MSHDHFVLLMRKKASNKLQMKILFVILLLSDVIIFTVIMNPHLILLGAIFDTETLLHM